MKTIKIVRLDNDELFSPKEPTAQMFKYAGWKYRILQACQSEKTMRELIGLCAQLVEGAAFLLDRSYKISFFAGSSCTDSVFASGMLSKGGSENAALNGLLEAADEKTVCYEILENGDICWTSRVSLEKTEEFYIVLFTPGDAVREEISMLLGMLQESFIEVNLRRQNSGLPLGDFRLFMKALADGRLTGWDEISAYAKRLPSPPKRFVTIAVAHANPSMGRTSIEGFISQLKSFFSDCSAAEIGEQVVFMISNETRVFQPKPIFSEKDMHALLTKYDGFIAFSNVTQRFDMWRTNYLLAESTLRLGRAIQERGGSRIFYYEDYAEYISIELSLERYSEIMKHDDLLFLTSPDAVRIYRYDNNNGTDLQSVLYYFCKNNGNVSLAAKEAFMHRNTFAARMSQIKEILKDVDLNDGRIQHRLLFSCKVFRYYNLYYDKKASRSLSERLSVTT